MSGAKPSIAMVLAAGLGLRMRPLTEHMPKPLVPVAGIPLIDRVLDWLAVSGIRQAVVNSHYKADMLEAHLASRRLPALQLSREDIVLETGGGIRKALPLLGQSPFFSTNSDTLCIDRGQPALECLWQAWDEKEMDALLLLFPAEKAIGYDGAGDFFLDEGGALRRRLDYAAAPYVFTGVQLIHPRLFTNAPEGAFSMNVLYNRQMKADGTLHRIYGIIHHGDWLHIGDPNGLGQAENWLLNH